MKRSSAAIIPMLLAFTSEADVPSWMKNGSLKREGNTIHVSCFASGVSLEIARKLSLQSCRSSVISQLQTTIEIKSKVIESESNVAYHEEVNAENRFNGLSPIVEKEQVEKGDDQVTVYQLIKFDMSKVKVSQVDSKDQPETNVELVNERERVQVIPNMETPPEKSGFRSDSRILILSVVPPCKDVLIISKISRAVKCTGNPITLKIGKDDRELIIRAKGYLPKHIPLSKDERSTTTTILELYLEKN